ncbi:MAG: site-2 protease family protein [Syntrophales bacterium]|nr:site-2 protease family protein [Syntrophales bacterium]MDD4340456.1 site-2 protease family protein [Syntrophales bacterium]HOG08498.1 site-2 protease family protein [Syntrophales bacterium]HOS76601.1 site-2 protease family protein [Syntrophales bacterium]HPB70239.1 site-2 protease family protein [Syntrophales bacterium]
MGLLKLLIDDPLTFVLLAIPLLYSIIVHELAHGWVALRMGDPTAKNAGRLTLNPLSHLDPIGTIMLFIVGFGWARPVPVNLGYIRDYRRGLVLVSSAGIVANMIFAFLAVLLLKWLTPAPQSSVGIFLFYLAQINLILAAFNLIPIPPLDGSKILMGFLPERMQDALARLEPYGFFIIIGLLFVGALNPLIRFFRWLILVPIGFILS